MAEKRRASGRTRPREGKRQRTSRKAATAKDAGTPRGATPQDAIPAVEEIVRQATPLPNKVVDSRALPTLSEPQSFDLSNEEYRSIADSGVLLASLERSRQKWVSGSFLEKYWTKTSGRKDAPPAPAGNPHKTWMKEIGPCTIVVEPLIIEATAFYVKEPGPTPIASASASTTQYKPQPYQPQFQHTAPQQYHPQQQQRPNAAGSPYGAPYSHPSSQYPGRPHPAPIMPATARAPPPPPPAAPAPAKQSPDPVIQMLASRASSDAELKALMKIVATGNANQDQLRIFQRHIDELTAMINANKAQSTSSSNNNNNNNNAIRTQPTTATNSPAPSHHQHAAASRPPSTAPPTIKPHPMPQYQHQPPPPPRYPSYPIVIEFQGPSASPDRFRFPENTMLEFLNSYKMLASFLVIRKGLEIASNLDPDTDYYEPVTMTISVPEARAPARDVLQFITRCVKPADQVRTWMTEQIQKCTRAPIRCLAFRLPYKSGITETEEEPLVVLDVKPKPKPVPRKKKDDNVQAGEKAATPSTTQATPSGAAVADPATLQDTTKAEASTSTCLPTGLETLPADTPAEKGKEAVRIEEVDMTSVTSAPTALT